jgi:hypothetical protein
VRLFKPWQNTDYSLPPDARLMTRDELLGWVNLMVTDPDGVHPDRAQRVIAQALKLLLEERR